MIRPQSCLYLVKDSVKLHYRVGGLALVRNPEEKDENKRRKK